MVADRGGPAREAVRLRLDLLHRLARLDLEQHLPARDGALGQRDDDHLVVVLVQLRDDDRLGHYTTSPWSSTGSASGDVGRNTVSTRGTRKRSSSETQSIGGRVE